MRGYASLTVTLAKSQLREPVGFFFLVVFSPALLLILGMIFGNSPAPEFGGISPVENMFPGIMTMSMIMIGTIIIPQTQAQLRTSGALVRLRMTPLKPHIYLLADMTVNVILGLISKCAKSFPRIAALPPLHSGSPSLARKHLVGDLNSRPRHHDCCVWRAGEYPYATSISPL